MSRRIATAVAWVPLKSARSGLPSEDKCLARFNHVGAAPCPVAISGDQTFLLLPDACVQEPAR